MAKRMHIDDDMGIDKICETLKMVRPVIDMEAIIEGLAQAQASPELALVG